MLLFERIQMSRLAVDPFATSDPSYRCFDPKLLQWIYVKKRRLHFLVGVPPHAATTALHIISVRQFFRLCKNKSKQINKLLDFKKVHITSQVCHLVLLTHISFTYNMFDNYKHPTSPNQRQSGLAVYSDKATK